MEPSIIFWGSLAFTWLVYLWETYLSYRQYRRHRDAVRRPADVTEIIEEEDYVKARLYKLDRHIFGFVYGLWSQIESSAALLLFLLAVFWNISGHIIGYFGYDSDYEIVQSLVFVVLTNLLSTLLDLPWTLYDTFVIEERHGFNKQTLGFFVKDQLKKIVVSMVIGLPILTIVLWIVRVGGSYFFLYLWIFCSLMMLFLMTIYPELIAPLFDKYTPLPDGPLRTQIEALAAKLNFPLKKLFVVEGSKRSAHSNAYLYGIWNNKRIVLYDTLLENYSPVNAAAESQDGALGETSTSAKEDEAGDSKKKKKKGCADEEVVGVIGHELGHWKLSHNLFNIIISEVNLLLCFGVFAWLYQRPELYLAFGFTQTQPTLIGLLIIFQFIFAPYNEVLSFVLTWLTRQMEFGADRFAAELGYSRVLARALVKLGRDNLSLPVDDWLFSLWHHSHPPVPERVRVLRKFD